jgi:hypothetical protein
MEKLRKMPRVQIGFRNIAANPLRNWAIIAKLEHWFWVSREYSGIMYANPGRIVRNHYGVFYQPTCTSQRLVGTGHRLAIALR